MKNDGTINLQAQKCTAQFFAGAWEEKHFQLIRKMKLILLNYYYYTMVAVWLRYAAAYGRAEHRWREKRQLPPTGTTLSPLASVGSCPPLTAQNGIVNYLPIGIAQSSLIGAAQPAGTTALLTCPVGFFPLGASSAQCLSNSQWSTPLGTCQPVSSGSAVGVGGTPLFPQTTAVPGGSLIGATGVGGIGISPTVVPTTPTTVGLGTTTCAPMLAPLGGQLVYSTAAAVPQPQGIFGGAGYTQGTTVQLYCSNGAAVNGGASQAVCQFGQWQPISLGQCLGTGLGLGITPAPVGGIGIIGSGTTLAGGVGCLPAAVGIIPPIGIVQYSQQPLSSLLSPQGSPGLGTTATYPAGTTATLQCQQGLPSGAQSSICTNGIWSPPLGICTGGGTTTSPIIGGQPQQQQLGNAVGSCLFGLMAPLGASLQYSSGSTVGPFPSGTSAQVICQQGLPQSTSVCSNGQWQPPLLAGCSAQSALTSGISSGLTGTVNTGLNTVSGGLNQLGIGTQCLLGMAPVIGGNVVYSSVGPPYAQGTIANLQCANGQLPAPIGGIGATTTPTATCIGGQWQPAQFGAVQCAGVGTSSTIGTFGQTTTSFPSAGFGTTTPLVPLVPTTAQSALQQQCVLGIVGLPLNGRIQYSNGAMLGPFPAGTTATLACNSGFVPNGQTAASCQNGQFQPAALGQCVQSSADAATTPYSAASATTGPGTGTNNTVVAKMTMATAMTTSSTMSGGGGTSSSSRTAATFGINGTGAVGLLQDCIELPQPLNGRFVYSPMGLSSPYPIGTTMTLVCTDGTRLPDGTTVGRSAVCHSDGWAMPTLLNSTCLPSSSSSSSRAADGNLSIK